MELCSAGNGGQSASGAVKGEGGSSVFLFRGDGGQSASGAVKGEGGGSQLCGGVVGFFVSGSGAVKGEGGPVSFGVWWWCRRFFVSGGRGPVSFRGCEGGKGGSQLCVKLFAVVAVVAVVDFVLGGRGCPTFDTCQEVCSVRK